jgi:type 2A phosphatase activator TIP41
MDKVWAEAAAVKVSKNTVPDITMTSTSTSTKPNTSTTPPNVSSLSTPEHNKKASYEAQQKKQKELAALLATSAMSTKLKKTNIGHATTQTQTTKAAPATVSAPATQNKQKELAALLATSAMSTKLKKTNNGPATMQTTTRKAAPATVSAPVSASASAARPLSVSPRRAVAVETTSAAAAAAATIPKKPSFSSTSSLLKKFENSATTRYSTNTNTSSSTVKIAAASNKKNAPPTATTATATTTTTTTTEFFPTEPSPPSSPLLKECMESFYDLTVRWTRGLDERKALREEWKRLLSHEFSLVDAFGKLWTNRQKWLEEGVRYGSSATWLTHDIEIRNFAILRQGVGHMLMTMEVWQCMCLQDIAMQQITAVRVTAWLRLNENYWEVLHLQETWIDGQEPKLIATTTTTTTMNVGSDNMETEQSSVASDKQLAWKNSNIPSRRRHISDRLEEFNAKPLLWKNQLVGISTRGWDIGTSQGPIGDGSWFAQATQTLEESSQYKLALGKHRRVCLPEMVFPAAHVALERAQGDLFISWDAMDALKEWGEAHQAIPLDKNNVAFRGVSVLQSLDAKLWENKQHEHEAANVQTQNASSSSSSAVFHYDWTFSTPFSGKVYGVAGSNGWKQLPKSAMPMQLLTDQSVPILFFDEIILLEDDLHDNGEVKLTVKLRVMPTCAYVLSVLFVRVDGVLLRLRECRLLVDFRAKKLYRDVTWRECQWQELAKNQLPTDLRAWTQDSNKETPAFLFLLSKLPLVALPRDLFAHAVMIVDDGVAPESPMIPPPTRPWTTRPVSGTIPSAANNLSTTQVETKPTSEVPSPACTAESEVTPVLPPSGAENGE